MSSVGATRSNTKSVEDDAGACASAVSAVPPVPAGGVLGTRNGRPCCVSSAKRLFKLPRRMRFSLEFSLRIPLEFFFFHC